MDLARHGGIRDLPVLNSVEVVQAAHVHNKLCVWLQVIVQPDSKHSHPTVDIIAKTPLMYNVPNYKSGSVHGSLSMKRLSTG